MTHADYSYDMNNWMNEYYDFKKTEATARRKAYEEGRATVRKLYQLQHRDENNLRRRERYWGDRAASFFLEDQREWRRCRALEITYKAAADRLKFARLDDEGESLTQEYILPDGPTEASPPKLPASWCRLRRHDLVGQALRKSEAPQPLHHRS